MAYLKEFPWIYLFKNEFPSSLDFRSRLWDTYLFQNAPHGTKEIFII